MARQLLAALLALLASICPAKEVEFLGPQKSDRNWLKSDREAVVVTLLEGTAEAKAALIADVAAGTSTNTFMATVLPNLLAGRSTEYKTILQRNALYAALSATLKHHSAIPESVRGIRFFDATVEVTGPGGLGKLETLSTIVKASEAVGFLDTDAREHLEVINAILLKRNFDVLRRVVKEWRDLRSPLLEWKGGPSPWPVIRGRLDAATFDATMVLFEQESIERYLSSTKIPNTVRASIDKVVAACDQFLVRNNVVEVSKPLCEAQRWGAEAGLQTKTFFDRQGRIATGQALVYALHGKSKFDFLKLIETEKAWLGSAKRPSDLIFVGTTEPGHHFFAIAGSFASRLGAEKQRAEMLRRLPSAQLAIFPPKKPDIYWTVASAAFSTRSEAQRQVQLLRESGASLDAYMLSRTLRTKEGAPFEPLPSSLQLPSWPTKPGARPNTIDPDTHLLMEIKRYNGKAAADAAMAKVRARFPNAPVALMDVDGSEKVFSLVIGGFMDELSQTRARDTARLLGFAPDQLTTTQLPLGTLSGWVDRTSTLSLPAASNAQRVIQCYGNARQTIQSMLDCSGFVLTPATLVRCIQGKLAVEDECFPMTLDQIQRTRGGLEAFLAEQKIALDDVLQVKPEDLPLPKGTAAVEEWAKKIYECKQVANNSDRSKYEACILPLMPKGGLKSEQVECFTQAKSDQGRVAQCISKATGAGPATPEQLACVSLSKGDSLAQARCFMTDAQRVQASDIQECVRASNDALAALSRCKLVQMNTQQEEALVACVSAGANSARNPLACAKEINPQVAGALERLECLKNAAGSAQKQLQCAAKDADPAVAPAIGLAQCANGAGTSADQLGTCVVSKLGGDAARGAAAVACLHVASRTIA